MATKAQAMKMLAKLNCTLDEYCAKDNGYVIDAPTGKVFIENGEHAFNAGHYDAEDACAKIGDTMPDIWDRIIYCLQVGLEDCANDCAECLENN